MKRTRSLRELAESGDPDTFIRSEIVDLAESIAWEDTGLSFRAIRDMAVKNYRKLGESNPAQAFGQLLRAGIQAIANGWYDRSDVSWNKYIEETSSDKRQEFYAPLYGSDFPSETGPGEPYKEQKIVGIDRELINRKYMGGESFDRELFDDDQTGQIRQRAGKLGDGARQWEEAFAAARLSGLARTFGGRTVAASNYTRVNQNGTTITGPFSTNFYATGQGNRPAAFGQLTFPNLKVGIEKLLDAVDPLGIRLAAMPDTVVVSNFDNVNARTLLNSTYYPGVPGQAGQTNSSAVSGAAGIQGADNVLKGMLNLHGNTYLQRGEWYLGKAKKGLIFQRRDPLEVVQEMPNSGQSFQTDTIRFRTRMRWVIDWIDASFWYQGNDGTAVVSQ